MRAIGKIIIGGRAVEQRGHIYKNFDAFENQTEEICYIPESDSEDLLSYTYRDFYYMAKEFIVNNPDVADWVNRSGYNTEMIAKQLFLSLNRQLPYALIDEWEQTKA